MYCRSSMLLYVNLCLSVFSLLSCSNRLMRKVPGDGLKPVANTEYRDVEFEDCGRQYRSSFFVDAPRSAGEDDSYCRKSLLMIRSTMKSI